MQHTGTGIVKSDWKLRLHWKEEKLSSKMRLEIAKKEGIYISLRPFPLVEAARFWFTPKEVVIVNLREKYYARGSYEDFSLDIEERLNYRKLERYVFKQLKKEKGNKEGQLIELDKSEDKTLQIRLIKAKYLTSSEDLHLTPIIKDKYREMSPRELKYMLNDLFAKPE